MNVPSYDAFISYNSADSEIAREIAAGLTSRELKIFVDQWYLRLGLDWQEELERVLGSCRAVLVLVSPNGLGSWQQREKNLALDLQARRADFPVIPVLLEGAAPPLGFLSLNTWVALTSPLEDDTLDRIAAALRTTGGMRDALTAGHHQHRCPYRGLEPFREEDADLFFGREVFTNRLKDTVARSSFVAVAGASGSGKSSVVRAGLLPALRQDRHNAWEIAVMRPGSQPFHALAGALLVCAGESESLQSVLALGRELGADPATVLEVVISRILGKQPGTRQIALVLDQFEELYTACLDDRTRETFIAALLGATRVLPLKVIMTVRGDFLGRIFEIRELSDRLEGAVVHIAPMITSELEQSVREPARKVGIAVESGLTNQLVRDAVGEPGHLPLLEFTLTQLWERRKGQLITLADYAALGGLAGALAGQAEVAYGRLRPLEQAEARRVLLALVNSGMSEKPTRQRARVADLGQGAAEVVVALTRHRLLVTDRDAADGCEIVEVAHEALIFHWPRFQEWLTEDKAFLAWRSRMLFLLDDWLRFDKEDAALLSGYRLAEAEEVLKLRSGDVPAAVVQFIVDSVAVQRRLEEERRHIAEREREMAERERRYMAAEQSTQDFAHALGNYLRLASTMLDKVGKDLDRSRAELSVKEEVRRLGGLVGRMQQIGQMSDIFASLSSGREIRAVAREIAPLQLAELVKKWVVDAQAGTDPQGGILFSVSFDVNMRKGKVRCDTRLFEIVVRSLLDNASKYSFTKTKVQVQLTIRERVELTVRNKGLIVKPEDVKNVVARGFRGREAIISTPHGVGIGLWISSEIMRALAGDLTFFPTDSRGITEVRVRFPS